jgi:hypothetical protein
MFQSEPDYDPFADRRQKTVGEKEDEYQRKRRKVAAISPERVDPFADGKFRNVLNPYYIIVIKENYHRLYTHHLSMQYNIRGMNENINVSRVSISPL